MSPLSLYRFTWNASKKRYIQSTEHDRALKIKLDSGVVLSDSNKGKMYEQWKKKTNRTLPSVGTMEPHRLRSGHNLRQFHQGKRKRDVAFDNNNAGDIDGVYGGESTQKGGRGGRRGVRSELKNASVIRKERKEAEKKQVRPVH